MKWSLRIARIAGIDLKLHVSFLLIVIFGAAQYSRYGLTGMAFGAALVLLLFLCVTLHEFGHSLVAQRFGIPVREIILFPLGGVAFLSRNPNDPRQEVLIAVAGPLVNVVIAAALATLLASTVGLPSFNALLHMGLHAPSAWLMVQQLLIVNVMLVLFNMIPAFPMDGGRVLRGLLGFRMSWERATYIATIVGQIMAVLLFITALLNSNLILGLIAYFVYTGAGTTRAEERARTVLSTLRIGDAYNKYALTLTEHDRVSKVADYILTSYQPDFAVMRGKELLGVVTRETVRKSLAGDTTDRPVFEIMQRNVPHVPAAASLDDVNQRLDDADARVAAVYSEQTFLGLVSAEDIAEAYSILAFMKRQSQSPAPGAPVTPTVGVGEPIVRA